MKNIELKNGGSAIIREAKVNDAKGMLEYCNLVGGETDFLTFGENEFKISLEDEERIIENITNSQNQMFLVAIVNNEIASLASVMSNQKARSKHVGTVGISVKEKYWGLGIGNEVMKYIIEWAKSNGVTKKINLLVREDNYKAISLYKKLGFEDEGMIKQDMCVNGVYYNTIMMGLIL
ncbi:MAG: GNAT family N-acetyltransferase [Peptostreptococcaceae bacterium]